MNTGIDRSTFAAMFSIQHQALLQDQLAGQQLQIHARPKPSISLAGVDCAHLVKPALYLSGDSLDYFVLPDGRLLAYLLDVSGSGTAAALLCMLIKSMVRHSVAMRTQPTPANILSDVNQLLLEAEVGKYATMVCLIVDSQAQSLQWSHAGHTPRPMFFSDSCQQLTGSGKPIGLFADAEYENQQLQLTHSFAFVVFSDGIFDCLPKGSFAWREEFLAQQVSASQGNFARLRDRLHLTQLQQVADDVSLLVISRNTP